ncbi:RNA polymerase sigma factor, sigma-70 family [Prosthecobacter debontii]|uniref:RNA polymerase sigma factor, sigma-70 family n=1 Tax=Prosthecobacter debontii TaxID=48467 RepID=A0A1T4YH40_9BACT|nr:sigma-70 family RNA polymerase sigma factor [Prosthecobacter debontii]SKB01089.1 RNA polymerase sigma factor, sigma-70 family [Prosthecobacter debontii]
MSSASASAPFQAADYEFAQDLLDGDRTAWGRFDQELKPAMLSKLLASGATNADAQEVIGIVMEKLWAQKKLAAYTGSGPLVGFVRTMAANAWLEYLRKHRRMVPATNLTSEDSDADPLENLSRDERPAPQESPLAHLLKDALLHALAQTDAEALLILRLSLLQEVRQRDLCQLWGGCHEGTISRKKTEAMEQIRDATLAYLAEREPSLQISWQDLLEACGDGAEAILGPSE